MHSNLLNRLLFCFLTLFPLIAFADSIVLKNGKTLDGTVVSELKDTIIFKDSHGTLVNLKKDEIEKIDRSNVPVKSANDSGKSKPPKVVTKEYLESLRGKYDLGEGSFGEAQKIKVEEVAADYAIEQNPDFDSHVLRSNLPVMVDFYADWCGPCRVIAPRVAALEKEFEGKLNVYRVNIDTNKDVASYYSIEAIPTLLFFKQGRVVDRIIGAASETIITSKLKPLLQ